jgi:hypothetical protein
MCGRFSSFLPAEALRRLSGRKGFLAHSPRLANPDVAELHDRMPLIVEEQDGPARLGEVVADPAAMLHPSLEGTLHVWPVAGG